jgi:hypothetical protein
VRSWDPQSPYCQLGSALLAGTSTLGLYERLRFVKERRFEKVQDV